MTKSTQRRRFYDNDNDEDEEAKEYYREFELKYEEKKGLVSKNKTLFISMGVIINYPGS